MYRLIDKNAFEDAKQSYLFITNNIDDTDIGNIHKRYEYGFTGKLRLAIIFIPLYYFLFKRQKTYEFYLNYNACIEELASSSTLRKLFEVYNIQTWKKYGYYCFVSKYSIPKEIIDAAQDSGNVDIHADTAISLFTKSINDLQMDFEDYKLGDYLNISSGINITSSKDINIPEMELHLEPVSMYDIVALDDISLKYMVYGMHIVYILLIATIVSLFV